MVLLHLNKWKHQVKKIAKLIFMNLNNAWSDTEPDAGQRQMFPAAS
jgi:hypothetical protein